MPAMQPTTVYTVKYGDWLAKIAEEHGTTVGTIWNHPANSEHRRKRGSPDVLYPGDVLHIPVTDAPPPNTPPQPPAGPPPGGQPPPPGPPAPPAPWPYEPPVVQPEKPAPTWLCPTGACDCHAGPGEVDTVPHTIFLHDHNGERMAGARCRVSCNGVVQQAPASADAGGALELELGPHARQLLVEWAPADVPLVAPYPYRRIYRAALGDEPTEGVRRRLHHLGFSNAHSLSDKIAAFQQVYGLPVDGEVVSVLIPLAAFHDTATLPPLVEQPNPQGEGLERRPDMPPPPDIRPPAQGCLAAIEALEPADCHFSFKLFNRSTGEPIAGQPFVIETPGYHTIARGSTSGGGELQHGDVPAGDYRLHICGESMTVPAIAKDETLRPLLLERDR